MDPGPHRSWPPHQPGGNGHAGDNQHQAQSQPPRPAHGYGPGTPQHNPQQSPPHAPSGLPAPGGPFASFHSTGHSLASLAGLSQQSPRQPQSQAQRPDDRPPQPPQGPGFALPGLGQVTGQPSIAEQRERERAREAEQIHIKEEEDRRHREAERQRMEQAPLHQSQQGPPVHLHQPVAVGPRTIHGPNGLLGNPNIAGPPNVFGGGPVQQSQPPPPQQMQPGLLAPYGPGAQAPPPAQQPQQPMAPGQQTQGQGQGQQPILNDALSYLDQVKVQFADHPDVYNRFLDIMKDFKSGAIDTPGVIGRVSTLFAGNPELIQGFNTFLPPGYRIECGAGDDPNSIRVTTPMGTTVQAMPRPPSRNGVADAPRPAEGTFTPQPGSAQMAFSPSGRPVGPVAPGQQHLSPAETAARRQAHEELVTAHTRDQRGMQSLGNAATVTAAGALAGLPAGVSPRATPLPMHGADPMAVDAAGMEKRGPVEFNHAISYVNKIKNRFSSQPDIYKQFLEILQTYQRESKPIQDVYSQVTHLFKGAKDLLEDFKQFLPESAAQAKAAERARANAEIAQVSDMRSTAGDGMYNSPVVSREMGTPAHSRGLPPVGNFAPTPASKDNKRKRQGTGPPDNGPGQVGASKPPFMAGPPGKRAKPNHAVAKNEQPPTSPTLIPSLPAPLPPTTTSAATSDEMSFFDKAKKAIGNKNVYNEFLKLCNLFSQDLIDRSTLLFRVKSFIGSNPDLVKWFEDWLGYDERDVVIENRPRIPPGRVMLSNCRGLGPSYRLLPKRERQKPCSGRDELCNSVLNDEWASHPTWASEDSGFIAHRKNVHEEGLHRIEEERHDYDFNIEAASRTIQLLEPIATQLRRRTDEEQRAYQLPDGLGGQSTTIHKRVIMKLYGREKGAEVIDNLRERPYQVIPILLNRVKERLETWKMGQREWEKVWREQTQKMFWKSLDHQAVQAKNVDRRAFQSKTLQGEINVRYEEMRRAGLSNPALLRQPQLEYTIDDLDVLVDTTHLVLVHVRTQMDTDHPRLAGFVEDFVPLFFGFDAEVYRARLQIRKSDELDEDVPVGAEDAASVGSRKGTGKNGGLLRAALDPSSRGRKLTRKDREDSQASNSRASTPEGGSNAGPEDMAIDSTEVPEVEEATTNRWTEHPITGNLTADGKDINPLQPQRRDLYRCWANSTLYCFIRLFVMLYERLHRLKCAEASVRKTVKDASLARPAAELGLIDKMPSDFFPDISDNASYYNQMVQKFEEVLSGSVEFAEVEEALRRFYLQSGYPLYPLEKLVATLAKDAAQVMNGDSKDKSAEIFALFKKDRLKDHSTAQQQTDYRKAFEKLIKDNELYRIDYDQVASKVKIFVSKREDPVADDGLSALDREQRWRYYIASYTSTDATAEVDKSAVEMPFLISNIKQAGVDPMAETFPPTTNDEAHSPRSRFLDIKNEERLELRIAVNNYRTFFQANSFESFHPGLAEREGGESGVRSASDAKEHRLETVKDRYEMNNSGMRDLSKEDVEKKNSAFTSLVETGDATAEAKSAAQQNGDVDMQD
ncbi:putative transcriptional regulatory protein Sin3 [Septoria linicola]|nr:putative transcriptional regulatory protein Sin3 [Septoria linicola]